MVLIVIRPDTIGRNPISLARVLPNEEKTDVAIIAAPMQNKQEDVEGDAPDDPHTPEDGQRRQRNAIWEPDGRSPRESQRAAIIVCGGKPDDQRWDMRNGNQPSRSRGTFIRLNPMNSGSRAEPRVRPARNGQGPPFTAGPHKSGPPHANTCKSVCVGFAHVRSGVHVAQAGILLVCAVWATLPCCEAFDRRGPCPGQPRTHGTRSRFSNDSWRSSKWPSQRAFSPFRRVAGPYVRVEATALLCQSVGQRSKKR